MKGVILAGGNGTRLDPLTKVTNKHLLPIYNKPMIYYPLETLKQLGMKEILIVTGKGNAGDFVNLLGSGRDFGIKISYEVQDEAGGIAQALSLAENFANGEGVVVMLGDNIITNCKIEPIIEEIDRYEAFINLCEVPDPHRFGVAEIDDTGKIHCIEEKPRAPKSNFAVIGLYAYGNSVFDVIREMKPSQRGELEITDVNNWYLKNGSLDYSFVTGNWTDAGTFESLHRATRLVRDECNKY